MKIYPSAQVASEPLDLQVADLHDLYVPIPSGIVLTRLSFFPVSGDPTDGIVQLYAGAVVITGGIDLSALTSAGMIVIDFGHRMPLSGVGGYGSAIAMPDPLGLLTGTLKAQAVVASTNPATVQLVVEGFAVEL